MPMWGRDFSMNSWISLPQLTGLIPDKAPKEVLAIVILKPFRRLRIKDGEGMNSITLRYPYTGCDSLLIESVLRIVLRPKLPHEEGVLSGWFSLLSLGAKPINVRPYLGRPSFRIMPHCPKPLISFFQTNSLNTASFCKFQGFVRRPSHPIQVRSSINSSISSSGMAGATFFNGIGTCSNSSSSLASSIVLQFSNLTLRQILALKPYPLLPESNNRTAGNSTKHLTALSLSNASS